MKLAWGHKALFCSGLLVLVFTLSCTAHLNTFLTKNGGGAEFSISKLGKGGGGFNNNPVTLGGSRRATQSACDALFLRTACTTSLIHGSTGLTMTPGLLGYVITSPESVPTRKALRAFSSLYANSDTIPKSDRLAWSPTIDKKRLAGVTIGTLGAYTAIMTGVGFAWYGNQKLGKFHMFEDSKEWLQIDKTGHWFAPYMITVYGYNMLRWSGMKNTPAALTAGAFGFLSLTAMEIPDGFADKYGASWSDIVFNFGGAAFATTQYLIWKEQRILTKYSFHLVEYPFGELRDRAHSLYGSNFFERVLKDYNGTTMWLSFNLHSFNHKIEPPWLNIAFGYAAGNLYGGFENKWTDSKGVYHDRSDLKRYRRFFISLDADFTKFKAKTRAGKMVLGILNVVKLPMPAIEFNTLGQFVFHPMYFLNFDFPLTVNMKRK